MGRGRKSKGREDSPPPAAKEDSPEPAMPTAQQVCEQWGLNDVDLEYTDADFQNLTTFKLFQQTYRPRIQAENPKVPMSKLVMLVAAKWREFTSLGKGEEAEEVAEEQEEQEEEIQEDGDEEEVPLSNRGRKSNRGRGRKKKIEEEEEEEEDYEEEEEDSDDGGRRRGRGKSKPKAKGKGGKAVPKLK